MKDTLSAPRFCLSSLEAFSLFAVNATANVCFLVHHLKEFGKLLLGLRDATRVFAPRFSHEHFLAGKKILNLYPGLAADAQADVAVLLQPTTDTVTYSDGYTEEVFGFDIPVPAIGEEFDVALVGEKGKWYDHKVSVSDPVPSAQ